jgi:hypothetical protein
VRRRRVTLAVALGSAIACAAGAWGVVSTQTGCELQGTCDQSWVFVPSLPPGATPGAAYTTVQGFQPDAGVIDGSWISSPIDGTWMNFPGQVSYYIYPQLPDGGPFVGPYVPTAFVSTDPNPYTNAGSNFSQSAGNIVEFSGLPDGGMTGIVVTNDTCSPYFLRLQFVQE